MCGGASEVTGVGDAADPDVDVAGTDGVGVLDEVEDEWRLLGDVLLSLPPTPRNSRLIERKRSRLERLMLVVNILGRSGGGVESAAAVPFSSCSPVAAAAAAAAASPASARRNSLFFMAADRLQSSTTFFPACVRSPRASLLAAAAAAAVDTLRRAFPLASSRSAAACESKNSRRLRSQIRTLSSPV